MGAWGVTGDWYSKRTKSEAYDDMMGAEKGRNTERRNNEKVESGEINETHFVLQMQCL